MKAETVQDFLNFCNTFHYIMLCFTIFTIISTIKLGSSLKIVKILAEIVFNVMEIYGNAVTKDNNEIDEISLAK